MTGAAGARRLASAFGAFALASLLASPALAQEVPVEDAVPGTVTETVVDPTQEAVEDPLKKVKKLVAKVVDHAEETVDDATEAVKEAVNETTEKVDQTVNNVKREVKELLENPSSPGRDDPSDRARRRNENDPRVGERVPVPTRVAATVTGRGGDERFARSRTDDLQPFAAAAASVADEPRQVAAPHVTPGDIAERLAFPLLMIAAVVAYLIFQSRIDRRDPKLLFQVDVDGERLSFE